jgi:hypothetical protein
LPPCVAEGKAPQVRYDGQYVEGRRSGVGKLSLPNGDRYHGMFEAGAFHGEGTYYYRNGDIYSGGWERGARAGQGTLVFARDRAQFVGTWLRGEFLAGKWVWADGTAWLGAFSGGRPLGRGVFVFPNGTAQEGEYVLQPAPADEEAHVLVWVGGATRPAGQGGRELLRPAPAAVA